MDTSQPQLSVPAIDLWHYLTNLGNYFTSNTNDYITALTKLIGVVNAICIPLIFFFLIAIVITVENIKRIRKVEDERYNKPEAKSEVEKKDEKIDEEMARRWKKVLEHVDSSNSNDWKLAIIEADVMLDQLVTKLGYRGDSLGEKLKRTVKGDFKSKDMAWDAHMVRNRIAHDGSAFEINQLEAKRVINMYRQVFEEFYHISS